MSYTLDMAYTPQTNPQALGNVTVATPGTPVQVTATLQATAAGSGFIVGSSSDAVLCNLMSFITSPIAHSGAGNTGSVYIGSRFMVRSTLAGVYAVLKAGQSIPLSVNVALNVFDANQFWVDADTAGDSIYGSIFSV